MLATTEYLGIRRVLRFDTKKGIFAVQKPFFLFGTSIPVILFRIISRERGAIVLQKYVLTSPYNRVVRAHWLYSSQRTQ